MYSNSMISAQQPEAAEVGLDILSAGGNAVDAAVACAFVQSVIDPLMTGIAGFGSLILRTASGEVKALDFHAPAPLAATEGMWADKIISETRDGYGFVLEGRVNDVGYQAMCTPANLRGWHEVHRAHGRLPWADVIAPAVRYAREGWVVRPYVHWFWSQGEDMGRTANFERVAYTEAGRTLYCREDGSPRKVGEIVRNPDYATTLEAIAEEGIEVFYSGRIAHEMIEDIQGNGGLLSLKDLAEYRPTWREPVWCEYKSLRLATNHPPGGGVMLALMLGIVSHFDLKSLGHNSSEYIRVLAEAMKRATILKDSDIADPEFLQVDYDKFLDPKIASQYAQDIKNGVIASVPRFNSGAPCKDTTQVTVVDNDGNCISITHSLGMVSGIIRPGHGFMHNACMAVFDPRPGRFNSIAPGKARFSSICPTIFFDNDKPVLVIGAPGATHIPMALLQACLNTLEFSMTMTEAVSAPRFSATSDFIDVSNRITRRAANELEAQGYGIIRSPESYGFAYIHGIRTDGASLDGGADPASGGSVLSIPAG